MEAVSNGVDVPFMKESKLVCRKMEKPESEVMLDGVIISGHYYL